MFKSMAKLALFLILMFVTLVPNAAAQPAYAFDFGYVDPELMRTIGGGTGFKGPFSVSLSDACESRARTTAIRDRLKFVVVATVRCDNGEKVNLHATAGGVVVGVVPAGVETVFQFRVGLSTGQTATDFVSLEMGIPGACLSPATVNVRNSHPTRRIKAMIGLQNYQTGRVTESEITLRPNFVAQSYFACAFGYSWVKSAVFLN